MNIRLTAAFLLIVSALFSCNSAQHSTTDLGKSKLEIKVNHSVDGQPIRWDSVMYTNAAGNVYSIERLQYYLSNFRFYRAGVLIFEQDSVFYIDARNKAVNLMVFNSVPNGGYDSVAFQVGVKEEHNTVGGLPATVENTNMIWPDAMGGGYHFLKLEGRYKTGTTTTTGYAMHIGSRGYQAAAGVKCELHVDQYYSNTMSMTMNVNEWFRTPFNYNLEGKGASSMGVSGLMSQLQQNGADAFTQD